MAERAELVLFRCRVLTMEPANPRAEAVAIAGGRVVAVGEEAAVRGLAGPGTRLLDGGGGALLPGFIDAHCHILAYLQSRLSLDLSQATSLAQLLSLLRERAQGLPPGTWLYAHGYDDLKLAEGRHPRRQELDGAAPHHPVRLLHRTGHAAVLNSLALSWVGISRDTPPPPGGRIERDPETGEPTGLLLGMSGFLRERLPLLSDRELEEALKQANPLWLSAGLTALCDTSAVNDLATWELLRSLKERERLLPRVQLFLGSPSLEKAREGGWHQGKEAGGVRLAGIKVVLDEASGSLYPPQEELEAVVLEAHRAGYNLAIHAMEPPGIVAAAAALERALGEHPRPHRHRLEHCSLCPPDLQEWLARLGLTVVTQPAFVYYNGDQYRRQVPPEEQPWLYPIASLKKMGVRVAAGSDSPVAPFHPLMGVYAAVTRHTEGGGVVAAGQALPPLEALALYTREAAYSLREEARRGTIAPGKEADLVLLSADPTTTPTEEIREIRVKMTLLGGKMVWEG